MIGKRIKQIRLDKELTQAEFGKRIGVKQAAVGLYETGSRNISDRVIGDVCREFNVQEEWLKNNEGDMYKPVKQTPLSKYIEKNDVSAIEEKILQAYFDLPKNIREQFMLKLESIFIEEIFENSKNELSSSLDIGSQVENDVEIYADANKDTDMLINEISKNKQNKISKIS